MVPQITVTPEFIAALAGAALSAFFMYFPKLNTKFAALDKGMQRLIMTGVLLFVTFLIFGLACGVLIVIPDFTCTTVTAVRFFWIFFYAAVANQTTYQLTPKPQAVIQVKAAKADA